MQVLKQSLLVLALAVAGWAQSSEGTPVNQTAGAPPKPVQQIIDYNGTSNVTYIGIALSGQITLSNITVSGASNANPVSFTATAHGFDYQAGATTTPSLCISGATGGWTGVNGCWVATPTSANAFTIPVNSTTFGSFAGQTLTVQTAAPLTTAPVWAIQHFVYNGSNLIIWSGWAALPAGTTNPVPGSTAMSFIWANRTTLSYQ